ncbi:MAG: D-alanyl-D-alanine carboxypeptidase [Chloroflexi bacterium]|nr:D-alanyl-D-alanine carboxypeptidase [Chloroflexota bacterium]
MSNGAAVCLACLTLACTGFGPPTLGSVDVFGPRFGIEALTELAKTPDLPVEARAGVLMDGETGHALAAANADARLAQASLTKMMTALVALDHADVSTVIRATEQSMSEPSVIGLEPGDALPLEEMLYGLLLPSGNDAALAIAETVGGGSITQFVGWMNDRAMAMGLRNTHFTNPTGLDADGHYSSARDLAETARALLKNPTLARVVSTPRYVVPGPTRYLFVNGNPLIGLYDGLDGVKTGFTDNAGRTFVASASRDGKGLIAVVLDSPDIRAEGQALLDFGFSRMAPSVLDVSHLGFARVGVAVRSNGQLVRLGGWELPFLRGFSGKAANGVRVSATLEGQTLSSWTR